MCIYADGGFFFVLLSLLRPLLGPHACEGFGPPSRGPAPSWAPPRPHPTQLLAPTASQTSPSRLKTRPAEAALGRRQDALKTTSRRPQTPPRRLQDLPRTASKRPQEAPGYHQHALKTLSKRHSSTPVLLRKRCPASQDVLFGTPFLSRNRCPASQETNSSIPMLSKKRCPRCEQGCLKTPRDAPKTDPGFPRQVRRFQNSSKTPLGPFRDPLGVCKICTFPQENEHF